MSFFENVRHVVCGAAVAMLTLAPAASHADDAATEPPTDLVAESAQQRGLAMAPPPDETRSMITERLRSLDTPKDSAKNDGLTTALGPSLFEKISGQYRRQDFNLFQDK